MKTDVLGTLKCARENGCPWDAAGGYLNILKWLRREGCPWNDNILKWWSFGSFKMAKTRRMSLEFKCNM